MSGTYIVAGMGYGDEGKGSIVDFLARETGCENVIRYNGGPQAAHHVVSNGKSHCFSQFGSATFNPGTRTILSEYCLVDPFSMEQEALKLGESGIADPYGRILIDRNCILVTPMHKIVNQMREISGGIGSCGMGVGEAVKDSEIYPSYAPRISDIDDQALLEHKLNFIKSLKRDQAEQIHDSCKGSAKTGAMLEKLSGMDVSYIADFYTEFLGRIRTCNGCDEYAGSAIFEGAQGVLLDVGFGFWPYVTKTRTTFENAEKLAYGCRGKAKKIGVIRPYLTKHGGGPFLTEDSSLSSVMPERHNSYNEWQGEFRIGWMDMPLARYSAQAAGSADCLALTNLDRISTLEKISICTSYIYCGSEDISGLFSFKEKRGKKVIGGIKKPGAPDRARQQQLGKILAECMPVYEKFYANASSVPEKRWKKYIDYLQSDDGIGIPVGIISKGPEAKDKTMTGIL